MANGVYNYDTLITVVATPDTGYHFVGWFDENGIVQPGSSDSFNIRANTTLQAVFAPNTYEVYLISLALLGGTTDGGGPKDYTSSVTVSAVSPTVSPTPTGGVLGVTRAVFTPVPNRVLNIRGTVLDKNNAPFVRFIVELHSDPVTAVTDANGIFSFPDSTLATHTFAVKNTVGDVLKTFTCNITTAGTFSWVQVNDVTFDFFVTKKTIGLDVTFLVDENNVTITGVKEITNPQTGDYSNNQWILFVRAEAKMPDPSSAHLSPFLAKIYLAYIKYI